MGFCAQCQMRQLHTTIQFWETNCNHQYRTRTRRMSWMMATRKNSNIHTQGRKSNYHTNFVLQNQTLRSNDVKLWSFCNDLFLVQSLAMFSKQNWIWETAPCSGWRKGTIEDSSDSSSSSPGTHPLRPGWPVLGGNPAVEIGRLSFLLGGEPIC